MAIIGISSIHLLSTFIEAEHLSTKALLWQTLIHLTFVVSAIALALIDRMSLPKLTAGHHRAAGWRPDAAAEPIRATG